MVWDVTADLGRFDEAIAWFLGRTAIPEERQVSLRNGARRRAFWIAGVAQLDIVQGVLNELTDAAAKGEPYEEFKKRVRSNLASAWGRDDPHRIETIFRNAIQTSYGRGRYVQMTEPAVKALRPFWMYDAILDTRTSAICQQRDRVVRPVDDTWWKHNYPPLHHRCRSTVRALRTEQALKRGITEQLPSSRAQAGFGSAPIDDELAEWRPEATDYDPVLWAEFHKKTG